MYGDEQVGETLEELDFDPSQIEEIDTTPVVPATCSRDNGTG